MAANPGLNRGPAGHCQQKSICVLNDAACVDVIHFVPHPVHLRHAEIAFEPGAVPVQKMPVEQIKRAGIRA